MAIPSVTRSRESVYTAHAYKVLEATPRDQYFTKNPLLDYLRSGQRTNDGGAFIKGNVEVGRAAIGGFYARNGTLAVQGSEVATSSETTIKFAYEPILVYHQDIAKAGGAGAEFDLVAASTTLARKALAKKIQQALYAASPGTDDIASLPIAMPDDPTASVAFQGLNGAAGNQTYWRNQVRLTAGSFATYGPDYLDAMLSTLAELASNGRPDAIFTTSAIVDYARKYARGHLSLNAPASAAGRRYADLGFAVVEHAGVPMIADPDATAGVTYFLNKDAIQLVTQSGEDFQIVAPFQNLMVNGVPAMCAMLGWAGNLFVYERRALALIAGWTA
jgi:hypothetical protein